MSEQFKDVEPLNIDGVSKERYVSVFHDGEHISFTGKLGPRSQAAGLLNWLIRALHGDGYEVRRVEPCSHPVVQGRQSIPPHPDDYMYCQKCGAKIAAGEQRDAGT